MGGGRRALAKNSNLGLCFYAEDKRYYLTFKDILDILDELDYPYTYYTSSEDDPALNRTNSHAIQYLKSGNPTYTKLNTLCCDLLVMTTPGLNVLHIKRNKGIKHYCHIVHSLTPMTYRVFGVDYFDSVLVTNEIQAQYVREIEKAHDTQAKHIAIVGSTYLDELDNLKQSITKKQSSDTSNPHTNPRILVSPSWGKESLLSKFGLRLLEPLAKSGFDIIIRPHPQSLVGKEESSNIESLKSSLQPYSNVSWDIGTPNVYAMAQADLLIGDFSSSIFDFICLFEKPVLSVEFAFDKAGYDMADLEGEMWVSKALQEIGAKLKESDFDNIKDIILSNLSSNRTQEIKNLLWQYPRNSAFVATKEILSLHIATLEIPSHILEQVQSINLAISKLDSMQDTNTSKDSNV